MSKYGPKIYALRKPKKMLSDFLDVFYNLQIAQNINITKKYLFRSSIINVFSFFFDLLEQIGNCHMYFSTCSFSSNLFLHISFYFQCFPSLLCMQMTLNIILEGYTSYSIIWNHIKSYLNHLQK